MAKPTYFFVNVSGDLESIAMRVKQEGYPIYYYKQKGMAKGREDTGCGIFEEEEMVDDKYKVLNEFRDNKEDLYIVVDDNGYGFEADYLKFEGWKVIGGSAYADRIEYERGLGTKIMGAIGLGLPNEHNFTSIDDGITFLEEVLQKDPEAKFVFKPEGEDFAGSAKTYTMRNPQDGIDYMRWIKSDCVEKHYSMEKFLLQEFVPGIEADFGGYFDGEKFMRKCVLLDIEEKKSGDGNKGEATGCMGNIVVMLDKSKYFDMYLEPLTPLLREAGFVGEVSINNIFSNGENPEYEEGMPFALEFTPRFGWDAHLTELAIIKGNGGSIAEFYKALADGKDYNFPRALGCGVRVYTGSISLKKEDVAGRFFSYDLPSEDDLWFYSVSKKEGLTIEDNPVLLLNTTGKLLKETISECYDKLKKLNIPDVYYRMEIGERAAEVLLFLRQYGWI